MPCASSPMRATGTYGMPRIISGEEEGDTDPNAEAELVGGEEGGGEEEEEEGGGGGGRGVRKRKRTKTKRNSKRTFSKWGRLRTKGKLKAKPYTDLARFYCAVKARNR